MLVSLGWILLSIGVGWLVVRRLLKFTATRRRAAEAAKRPPPHLERWRPPHA